MTANILHSLKRVAKLLRREAGGEKISLWITVGLLMGTFIKVFHTYPSQGHSLGAALSALVYARLLFTPKDLGDDLVLRQGALTSRKFLRLRFPRILMPNIPSQDICSACPA